MKFPIVAVVGLGLVVVSTLAVGQDAAKSKGEAPPELKDLKTKASYSLGQNIGRQMKGASIDLDADMLARGIKDALAGGKSLLTDAQMQEALQAFQQQVTTRQQEAVGKNKKAGDEFLAGNKAKPGVVALPSGLQYKVIKEGTGKTPKATDTVSTNYRGTLLDGTEFDSSFKTGKPVEFPVNGVIRGWTEALQRMKVGSKWQLFIPAELAYGATPPPRSQIPPNSVLVFEIELLDVK